MAKAELNKEWESRIAEFEASGQSVAVWCSNHNLKIGQTKYWLRKLRKKAQPAAKTAQWLSVEISEPKYEQKTTYLKVKVGAAVIEVEPGFNAKLLQDVVQTLNTIC